MIEQLTPLEKDVICHIPGNTDQKIALRLGISRTAVKRKIRSAGQKLRCTGANGESIRLRLFFKALRWGLITMSEVREGDRRERFFDF